MAQGAAAARRLTIIVVVALGVAGSWSLAGCSGDDRPAPSSSSSPTPTSLSPSPTREPTPTPTLPPKPATWSQSGADAAVDAAKFFADLYNYALATGDTSEWRALSEPNCEFCSGIADDIDAIYGAGDHYEGGEVQLAESVVIEYSATLRLYGVQHSYSSSASASVTPGGVRHDASPADSGFIIFDVMPTSSGWWLVEGRSIDTARPEISVTQP